MTTPARSGLFYFLAGALALMGIITAEALYPAGYTTAHSEISDLGATVQPHSVSYQPSADIFNATMGGAGLLVLAATGLLHAACRRFAASVPLALFGLGLVGIGIFPGNRVPYHSLCSMLAFLAGGVSAIAAAGICRGPLRYLGIGFGSVALAVWFSAAFAPHLLLPVLGNGGTERWVAYPIMLWLTGFGGYLMHETAAPTASKP